MLSECSETIFAEHLQNIFLCPITISVAEEASRETLVRKSFFIRGQSVCDKIHQ
jgi:hypothetical protein